MNLLKRLAKVVYHGGRSKVDRRHRLKYTTDFMRVMAVAGQANVSEDELTDAILDMADGSQYGDDEIVEATYCLACIGLDEEIPDVLPHTVTLAKRADCGLPEAADALATVLTLFGIEVTDAHATVLDLTGTVWMTCLDIDDVVAILTVAAPPYPSTENISDVLDDLVDIHYDLINEYPEDELPMAIRERLRQQYEDGLYGDNE